MTNVRWSSGDSHLVSVGGGDTAVMVWELSGARGCERGDSDDSDTDSEEEGGSVTLCYGSVILV